MENAPLVEFIGYTLPAEIEEKYNNWTSAAYLPNLVKLTPVTRVDRYQIVKKDPAYPAYFALWHLDNIREHYNMLSSKFRVDLHQDLRATFSKLEYIWITDFLLMKSFRNPPGAANERERTTIDNAPFLHLEAFRFTPEEEHKYVEWSVMYGNPIYIPLLMKIPGIKGFDRYRDAGIAPIRTVNPPRENKYPVYLQIIYFESIMAFENYASSPELASYRRSFNSEVSGNFHGQWSVQYQLANSFTK